MSTSDGMAHYSVVAKAITRAKEMGLRKPLDIAIRIEVALGDAGYNIVRKPSKAKTPKKDE